MTKCESVSDAFEAIETLQSQMSELRRFLPCLERAFAGEIAPENPNAAYPAPEQAKELASQMTPEEIAQAEASNKVLAECGKPTPEPDPAAQGPDAAYSNGPGIG